MSKMKVKAIKPGVYDDAYRQVGDVFEIDGAMFSKRWMEEEKSAPVQDTSQEALKAQRENREAALQDLGDVLAGNPNATMDSMSDADLDAYYEQVMGEKPRANAKRDTLIQRITDKLNAD